MTAILLAAGIGKRMGLGLPPKCLLAVGEKSLLQRTLEGLRSSGVREVVLVVGFRKEEIIQEAQRHAGRMRLHVLQNDRYQEGAILSLWAARDFLNRKVLIMDSDVLCPPSALELLLGSAHPNCLLVDGSALDTGEEQLVFGRAERVLHITKRPSEQIRGEMTLYGESLGFLKLSEPGAVYLRQLLEEKVKAGLVAIEHEQVYPQLFEQVPVGYERVDGLPWTEIDNPEDLRRAREEIFPLWNPPQCLNRLMAQAFLPWILPLPLTPNQWTCISLGVGLASIWCVAAGSYPMGLLGAVLFQAFYWVDSWDGDVARLKSMTSRWGGWFDVFVDMVVQVGLAFALAEGLLKIGAPVWVTVLGWLAAVGLALDFLITLWAKARGFGPAVFSDPSRGRVVLSDSKVARWWRANLTNENFSFLVVAVLLLDFRLPFLISIAVGSQVFWIRFLWSQRRRLVAVVKSHHG